VKWAVLRRRKFSKDSTIGGRPYESKCQAQYLSRNRINLDGRLNLEGSMSEGKISPKFVTFYNAYCICKKN
jgi:hypothetical protein